MTERRRERASERERERRGMELGRERGSEGARERARERERGRREEGTEGRRDGGTEGGRERERSAPNRQLDLEGVRGIGCVSRYDNFWTIRDAMNVFFGLLLADIVALQAREEESDGGWGWGSERGRWRGGWGRESKRGSGRGKGRGCRCSSVLLATLSSVLLATPLQEITRSVSSVLLATNLVLLVVVSSVILRSLRSVFPACQARGPAAAPLAPPAPHGSTG